MEDTFIKRLWQHRPIGVMPPADNEFCCCGGGGGGGNKDEEGRNEKRKKAGLQKRGTYSCVVEVVVSSAVK